MIYTEVQELEVTIFHRVFKAMNTILFDMLMNS